MSLSAEFAAKAETHRKLLAAQFPSEYHVDLPVLETSTNVSNVYKTSGILSSTEIEIVELDATDLAAAIARGVYSAVQVTRAFCRTAAIAHQTVNCLAWFAPEEALVEAGRLDEILASTGQTVGPLHGVPVSVKGVYCAASTHETTMPMDMMSWESPWPFTLTDRLHPCQGIPSEHGSYLPCWDSTRHRRRHRSCPSQGRSW